MTYQLNIVKHQLNIDLKNWLNIVDISCFDLVYLF